MSIKSRAKDKAKQVGIIPIIMNDKQTYILTQQEVQRVLDGVATLRSRENTSNDSTVTLPLLVLEFLANTAAQYYQLGGGSSASKQEPATTKQE